MRHPPDNLPTSSAADNTAGRARGPASIPPPAAPAPGRAIASARGAAAALDYVRRYPPTVNHAAEAAFAADVATENCGADAVSRTCPPIVGAEDFSYMLNARPGAMLSLGNGPGKGGLPPAQPALRFQR